MRLQLTKQECIWLEKLATKAKLEAALAFTETKYPLYKLQWENMSCLEQKLRSMIITKTKGHSR